jgi:hypothetical protein
VWLVTGSNARQRRRTPVNPLPLRQVDSTAAPMVVKPCHPLAGSGQGPLTAVHAHWCLADAVAGTRPTGSRARHCRTCHVPGRGAGPLLRSPRLAAVAPGPGDDDQVRFPCSCPLAHRSGRTISPAAARSGPARRPGNVVINTCRYSTVDLRDGGAYHDRDHRTDAIRPASVGCRRWLRSASSGGAESRLRGA